MPTSAHGLRPGEERRLRNRALIRWHMTASPATRILASLHGVTSILAERTEGLCAEVVSGAGRCLARYRVRVHAGRGYLYALPADVVISCALADSAELRSVSDALRTRSSAVRARAAALPRAGEGCSMGSGD